MKIAVIGAGNTGQAICAYLASKGADCVLNTRSGEKAELINRSGIKATGALDGTYKIAATTSLAEAISEAKVIIVMTIANAHREVAERLAPIVKENQSILVFNSNWGAFQFKKTLGSIVEEKKLTVAETSAQLFVAFSKSPGQVNFSVKESVDVSATDPSKTKGLLNELREYFPQFKESGSIFETTLSSTNPVIHVPVSLLNAARIENKQAFKFYGEGVSKASVEMILRIDEERVKVAKAIGCGVTSVLTTINSFWEIKHDNLFDALTKNETYLKSIGPSSFSHRFFTEDIPFGITPISKIGGLLNISTPYTDSMLDMLFKYIVPELKEEGVCFSREDFR